MELVTKSMEGCVRVGRKSRCLDIYILYPAKSANFLPVFSVAVRIGSLELFLPNRTIILLKQTSSRNMTARPADLSGCAARRENMLNRSACLAEFFFGLSLVT